MAAATRLFSGTNAWNAAAFGGTLPLDTDFAYLQNASSNLTTTLDRSGDFLAGEALATLNVAPNFTGSIGADSNELIIPADVVKFFGAGVQNYLKGKLDLVFAGPQKNSLTSLVLASSGASPNHIAEVYVSSGGVVFPSGSYYGDVWVLSDDPNTRLIIQAGAEITGVLRVLGANCEVYGTIAAMEALSGMTIIGTGAAVTLLEAYNAALVEWWDGDITTALIHDQAVFDASKHKELATITTLKGVGSPKINLRTKVGAITVTAWTPVGKPHVIEDDGGTLP